MRRALLLVSLSIAPVVALEAQEAADSALVRVLQQLPIGTQIRIRSVDGGSIEGALAQVTETRVVIVGEREQHADLGRVATVWLRHHRAKFGGITGGLIGALTIGALGAALAPLGCACQPDLSTSIDGFIIGGALGGAIGGVAGLVIGSFVTGWVTYWTRERA